MKVASITSQNRLLHWEWNPKTDKVEKANKKQEQYHQCEVSNNNRASSCIYWGVTVDSMSPVLIHSFFTQASKVDT